MKFFISCLFLLFSVQIQASKPNTQPKIVWLCNADGTAHCFLDGEWSHKVGCQSKPRPRCPELRCENGQVYCFVDGQKSPNSDKCKAMKQPTCAKE